jgi:hypothetical protein
MTRLVIIKKRDCILDIPNQNNFFRSFLLNSILSLFLRKQDVQDNSVGKLLPFQK